MSIARSGYVYCSFCALFFASEVHTLQSGTIINKEALNHKNNIFYNLVRKGKSWTHVHNPNNTYGDKQVNKNKIRNFYNVL